MPFRSEREFSDHALSSWLKSYARYMRHNGYDADIDVVKGSGNQAHALGDLQVSIDLIDEDADNPDAAGVGYMLGEHKATRARSRTIKLDELLKISREAQSEGRDPILGLSFYDEQTGKYHHWVLHGV